jgi:hypothetical protein
VDQFVGEEFAPGRRAGPILTGREDNVLPDRVGQGIHRASRLGRPGVGMHAHAAEVPAKTRLKEGSRRGVERLARGTQDLSHDRGRLVDRCLLRRASLECPAPLAAGCALVPGSVGGFAAIALFL